MPKTFPIKLEVEEFALGAVLRRLHDMQGIAKLDLDLGTGGSKPVGGNGHGAQEALIEALRGGPKSRSELIAALGSRARFYGAVHLLKKKRVVRVIGKGMYALTEATTKHINGPLALPSPVKKGPAGRAGKGESQRALMLILTEHDGGLQPIEIARQLANHGISARSLSGVLARGKRDGLIKKQGLVYVITAKGRGVAHG